MQQRLGDEALPPDAWARAILYLGCTDALGTRLVSHTMGGAFDRACRIGPAQASTLPYVNAPFVASWVMTNGRAFAGRVCQSLRHSTRDDGPAPMWLRFIRRDVLLAVLACGGFAEAIGGLAFGPFSFGPEDARGHGNLALRWAAENGHVAVLDRLAKAPYSLNRDDARSSLNSALFFAAMNGHVAVLDRLAAPPYSLCQDDARSCNNYALQTVAENGRVAILDRLAVPPRLAPKPREAVTTTRYKVRPRTGTSPSWTDWLRIPIRCNRKTREAVKTTRWLGGHERARRRAGPAGRSALLVVSR